MVLGCGKRRGGGCGVKSHPGKVGSMPEKCKWEGKGGSAKQLPRKEERKKKAGGNLVYIAGGGVMKGKPRRESKKVVPSGGMVLIPTICEPEKKKSGGKKRGKSAKNDRTEAPGPPVGGKKQRKWRALETGTVIHGEWGGGTVPCHTEKKSLDEGNKKPHGRKRVRVRKLTKKNERSVQKEIHSRKT